MCGIRNKHPLSFFVFECKELKTTSGLILSDSFLPVQLVLMLSSLSCSPPSPPSLFPPAKNHRTGKEGLSFSYLVEQRAHRVAKDCSFLLFPFLSLSSSLPSSSSSVFSLSLPNSSQVMAHIRWTTQLQKQTRGPLCALNWQIGNNLVRIDGCQNVSASCSIMLN